MGSRFLAPEWTKVFYFYHKIGNKLICLLFNLLFNTTWTDIYSCYLLFRRSLIDPKKLKTLGWEQQAEILGNICLQKPELYEVPINYNGRSYEQGKKIRWHHTFKVLFTIIKTRIFPTNHSIEQGIRQKESLLWYPWQDSNLRLTAQKAVALSAELQGHITIIVPKIKLLVNIIHNTLIQQHNQINHLFVVLEID